MPSLTVGDTTYENVTLKKEYPLSFFIAHDGGTAFVEKDKLSEEQTAELLGSPPAETSAPSGESATENKPAAAADATTETASAESKPPEETEEDRARAVENALSGTRERIGQEAPDIRLMDSELKPAKLSDLRGKVVLLNFNSWVGCPQTCLPDFVQLAELQEKYAGEPVEIVSVLQLFHELTWDRAIKERKITWRTSVPERQSPDEEIPEKLRAVEPLTSSDELRALFEAYGITFLATNVLVGKDGKIIGVHGPLHHSRQKVEDLIASSLAD